MPAEVFALRDADLELLLGRLWSGDGSLGGPGQMPYYATSSRQLALDVQTLLLRLGIVSRLRTTQFGYKYKGRESKRRAIRYTSSAPIRPGRFSIASFPR